MAITYNLEKDIRFKQGIQQGIERGIEQGIEKGIEQGIEKGIEQDKLIIVTNLILKTDFSVEKIADLAEVSVDFVLKVKKTLPSA